MQSTYTAILGPLTLAWHQDADLAVDIFAAVLIAVAGVLRTRGTKRSKDH